MLKVFFLPVLGERLFAVLRSKLFISVQRQDVLCKSCASGVQSARERAVVTR